jgi:hypothetical protein
MRTYKELKEADFKGMTDEEDSYAKRITNIVGYCLHSKLDANKYMEKVIELDKENGSTFIRELFFINLKDTFAKHEKSGRLSPEAIEAIKDWDKIEASFDAYIYSGETMIDYSTLVIVQANASSFDLCWKDSDLIMNAWMVLDFGNDYTIELDEMRYGYIN